MLSAAILRIAAPSASALAIAGRICQTPRVALNMNCRKSFQMAVLALSLLPPIAVRSEDWPQWRGPNRDGVWNETGVVESFPSSGLKISWRAPVGPGWSSPVVAQGRVYVTDVELARPTAQERMLCFNASNGKLLWSRSYAVDYPDWAFDPNAGGPRATPILRDGKLFTLGAMGHLFCLDAVKGEVVWEKSLAKEYGVKEFTGITASPLIEDERLILHICGKPAASVTALDKNFGKEVWKALTPRGDAVFLFTDRGDLIRAQLTAQGYREISRAHLLEPTSPFGNRKCAWTPPAYAYRHVFARNDKELVCASLAAEQ